MRNLFYCMLLIPFFAISQTSQEYTVVDNYLITANPTKIKELDAGLAAHNKKFHGEGEYQARVYEIMNGPRVGSFMWVSGPKPWSSMDKIRPDDKAHSNDWSTNVAPYLLPETDQVYWKFEPALSNISKDFTLNKLLVDMYDIKRNRGENAMKLVEKVKKVNDLKYPDLTYGIYKNELPSTNDGRDLAVVYFFDKWSWMGEDPKFPASYNEVHGEDSFIEFLKEWEDTTIGKRSEIWMFRKDLSGVSGEVKAAARQK